MLMYKFPHFHKTNCTHCCRMYYNMFSLVADASVVEECCLQRWGFKASRVPHIKPTDLSPKDGGKW